MWRHFTLCIHVSRSNNAQIHVQAQSEYRVGQFEHCTTRYTARKMTVRDADARVTCQTLQLTFYNYNYNYNTHLYCARFIFFPMKTPATFHFVLFCSFMSLVFRNVLSSFSFLLAKNHWIHGVITMTSEMLQKIHCVKLSNTHHRPTYASNTSTCLPTSCQ